MDNYSLLDHTHSNYVTSDQVSTIVNSSIQNGEITVSSSIIRQIIRGTKSISGANVTIKCSFTNIDKVIVLINDSPAETDMSCGVYLYKVTESEVMFQVNYSSASSYATKFSYQIIEFM